VVHEDRPHARRACPGVVEFRFVAGVQGLFGTHSSQLESGLEDPRFRLLAADDRGDHEAVDGVGDAEAVEELLQALAPVGQDSHEQPRTRQIVQEFARIRIQAKLARVGEARRELVLQLGQVAGREPEALDEDRPDELSEPRLAEPERAIQDARESAARIRHAFRHELVIDRKTPPSRRIRVERSAAGAFGEEGPSRVEENSLERHRRSPRIDSVKRTTKLRLLALCAVAFGLPLTACTSGKKRTDEIPDEVTPEIARASEKARQYERSAELWARLHIDSGGRELEPYLGCGRSLLAVGDVRGACAIVEQGLTVFPREVDLYLLHGEILSAASFRRAAERCYENAVILDRQSADAQLGLGRVRVELGLNHKALTPLSEALQMRPDDQETLRLYALASEEAGLEVQAFDARRKLLALEERPTAYRYVSTARLAFHPEVRESYPDALDLAQPWILQAIELDPQDSEAHYLQACEFELRGRHDAARVSFLRAVEVDPGNLEALTELANQCHRQGELTEADRFARMALELERDRRRRALLESLLIESR
jgi:tetratricopeptide (TPR) repeat protein